MAGSPPPFPSSGEQEGQAEHKRLAPTEEEEIASNYDGEEQLLAAEVDDRDKVLFEIPKSSLVVEPAIPSAPPMPEYLSITSLDGSPSIFSSEEEEEAGYIIEEVNSKRDHGKAKVGEAPPQLFLSPPRSEGQMLSSILSRRSKSTSLLRVRTGRSREKLHSVSKVLLFVGDKENEPRNEEGDENSYPSDKENMTPKPQSSSKLKKPANRELSALSVSRHTSGSNQQRIVEDKENCRSLSENGKNGRTNSRLKNAARSSSSKTYSEKENRPGAAAPPSAAPLKVRPKKLFSEHSNAVEDEDETYSSDKENHTPKPPNSSIKSKEPVSSNRRRIDSAIFKRRAAERVPFQSLLDSPLTKPITVCSSNAENSPAVDDSGVRREISAGRKGERVPFQTLVDRSTGKKAMDHSLDDNASSQNNKASFSATNCTSKPVTAKKKKWTIVADVSCFTDDESRKALQLLEGIRGTRLIIPKMVIRELDYLKRTESLFRKPASRASAILQWIEECMVKTSWWIHVQSSGEMAPVASTPPVTPRSELDEQLSEGMTMTTSFSRSTTPTGSSWGRRNSLAEIVSPTAEDHILDCALLFRKMSMADDEGVEHQTVLLTNSVSLKIKAMAEGLLCETAKDFRESLVNPFSERFLWVDSSPRGPTWSVAQEAAALVESQHRHNQLLLPLLTPAATAAAAWRTPAAAGGGGKTTEGAKGLKLILLHNSHYGQLNTVR